MTPKNDIAEFAVKKAFEIGYAVFRIAENIRQSKREHFAKKLEEYAIVVLGDLVESKFDRVISAVAGLDYFIKLGGGIGLIRDANSQVLIKELGYLNAAVAELQKISQEKKVPDLDIADIFTESNEYEDVPEILNKELLAAAEEIVNKQDNGRNNNNHDNNNHDRSDENNNSAEMVIRQYGNTVIPLGTNPAIRQSVIINRIRQNHNCRLKDIQEFLPDSSERTIRYDLQDLIQQGTIVRIGSGGPATYYQIAG